MVAGGGGGDGGGGDGGGDGGGNGGDNNNTDANKENNGNRKKRKNYGTWTPSIKFDKEWDGGKKGWFKWEQRQHKYKTDNALKKSDFPAW